ncbi:MAG: hypothetical protein M3N82_01850 [Pseudomonadota bacterium]|nr:hypothetical protein [Pseudomonadota bacterium]
MYEYWIPIVLAAALIGLNTFITYAIGRSALYSSRQKAFQIGLVWLLPVFGSTLVGGVLWSNNDRSFSPRHAADLEAGAIGGTGDPISYEQ